MGEIRLSNLKDPQKKELAASFYKKHFGYQKPFAISRVAGFKHQNLEDKFFKNEKARNIEEFSHSKNSLNEYTNLFKYKWSKSILSTLNFHSLPSTKGQREFLVCRNVKDVLSLLELGCIELHFTNFKVLKGRSSNPDFMTINLKNSEDGFSESLVQRAGKLKSLLDVLNVPSFPKTSESQGLHIYIPLDGLSTYKTVHDLARGICQLLPGKMFEENDPNLNAINKTVSTPYSLINNKEGILLFTAPLKWPEIIPGLDSKQFNIENFEKRINKVGDLFKDFWNRPINAETALKQLEKYSKK